MPSKHKTERGVIARPSGRVDVITIKGRSHWRLVGANNLIIAVSTGRFGTPEAAKEDFVMWAEAVNAGKMITWSVYADKSGHMRWRCERAGDIGFAPMEPFSCRSAAKRSARRCAAVMAGFRRLRR